MANQTTIEATLDRMVATFQARPASAHSTTTTHATLRDGFMTRTREDGVAFTADMPVAAGGSNAGPTPGVYGRACLASCIAMGIRIAAERRGIAVDQIDVSLSMDWDSRGLFGLSGVSAGPSNIALEIDVESPAPDSDVQALVAEGMSNDPWLIALTQPHTVTSDLRIRESR